MTRQDVFEYCRKQYKTQPDYPWKDWNAVLRHTDNNKWYGLVMEVKCDPILSGSLRMQPGFFPAYHMNKEKWISIMLSEASENDEMIKNLIDWSYQATEQRKRRSSK